MGAHWGGRGETRGRVPAEPRIRLGDLCAVLQHVAWYVPSGTPGRQLYPLRAAARAQGHRLAPWGLLFTRHDAYHVYWTRCRHCGSHGRLTVISEGRTGVRRFVPSGTLLDQACPGGRG